MDTVKPLDGTQMAAQTGDTGGGDHIAHSENIQKHRYAPFYMEFKNSIPLTAEKCK
jgi:hypothetical protein